MNDPKTYVSLYLESKKQKPWSELAQDIIKKREIREMILMDATTKVFGMDQRGKELKALLEKREIMVSSGNPTGAIDLQLESYNDIMFSPKKTLMLRHLDSMNVDAMTEDQKDMYKLLSQNEMDFRPHSPVADLPKYLNDILEEGKTLKIAKVMKTVKQSNGFKRTQEMSFMPEVIRVMLKNPVECSPSDIPTSVIRAKVTTSETAETKKPIVKIDCVSVVYDEYTNSITNHLWTTIYDVVDKAIDKDIEDIVDEDIM